MYIFYIRSIIFWTLAYMPVLFKMQTLNQYKWRDPTENIIPVSYAFFNHPLFPTSQTFKSRLSDYEIHWFLK